MTTPASPQDPQPGRQPQQPSPNQPYGSGPGYGTPGYGNAPAAPGGQGSANRPGTVTAAAVIAVVIGGLGTLGGLLSLTALGLVFSIDALLGILTLLSLAVAVSMLVAGIQALTGKAPKNLLLASYVSIVVQVLYVIWSLAAGYGFEFIGLLGFVLPVLIVALLRQPASRQYYAARGQSY